MSQPVYKFIIGIVSSLLLTCPALHATEVDAKKLAGMLNQFKVMQGNFSQETLDAKGKIRQQQSGHFAVKNTGEFLWNIHTPYQQVITSDGKEVHIYDPDLEQITYKKLDAHSQSIPLLLFSDDATRIIKAYDITLMRPNTYLLKPRTNDSLFETLEIVIQPEKPESLTMTDALKQVTSVKFTEVKVNTSIDSSIWKISIPDNTEIVDER